MRDIEKQCKKRRPSWHLKKKAFNFASSNKNFLLILETCQIIQYNTNYDVSNESITNHHSGTHNMSHWKSQGFSRKYFYYLNILIYNNNIIINWQEKIT